MTNEYRNIFLPNTISDDFVIPQDWIIPVYKKQNEEKIAIGLGKGVKEHDGWLIDIMFLLPYKDYIVVKDFIYDVILKRKHLIGLVVG